MDEDDLHITMEEEFERQNPNLDARGGGIIYYDPLAYKIEVYDYIKNTEKPVLVKKEIYRVYRWRKVTKSENVVTEFLKMVNYALFD